jgi:predicted DNA-binding protein (UPF0251 family)
MSAPHVPAIVYRVRAHDARRRVVRGEHQTPQFTKPSDHTNMSPIEDALAEIESLRSTDSICYTTIAEKHGFWRSTLTRRHQATTIVFES